MIVNLDAYGIDGKIKEEAVLNLGEVTIITSSFFSETLDRITFHFANKTTYEQYATKDVYETLVGCFETTHP